MENYSRARVLEQPSECPFADLPSDTPELRVRDGSKIRNLLRFALSRLELDSHPSAPPVSRTLVLTASGPSVSKAVTCAEIIKRRLKGLHQLNRLSYSSILEVWEPLGPPNSPMSEAREPQGPLQEVRNPLEPLAGLDSISVSRKLPSIWILLSQQPLDSTQPGYQAPGNRCPWDREEGVGPATRRAGHVRRGGAKRRVSSRQAAGCREPAQGHT